MSSLWPPPSHPFLYLAHVAALYSLLRIVFSSDIEHKEISWQSTFFKYFTRSTQVALSTFVWLGLPLRIAEMHAMVIVANFLHMLALTYIVTGIMISGMITFSPLICRVMERMDLIKKVE
ncbi:hypothetical protein Ddc_07879 [Ditylenchus destructor]|nr:hypothetical protein Ddc_07879 [Ditylenchus destructor]